MNATTNLLAAAAATQTETWLWDVWDVLLKPAVLMDVPIIIALSSEAIPFMNENRSVLRSRTARSS